MVPDPRPGPRRRGAGEDEHRPGQSGKSADEIRNLQIDPVVKLYYLELPRPSMEDQRSDLERAARGVAKDLRRCTRGNDEPVNLTEHMRDVVGQSVGQIRVIPTRASTRAMPRRAPRVTVVMSSMRTQPKA